MRLVCLFLIFWSNLVWAVIPFQNMPIAKNRTVTISYSFGKRPVVFCYNTQGNGTISWPYKGKQFVENLPVVLTDNINYEGQLADKKGRFRIANTQKLTLIVSCLFAY